ncbi:acetate kinase [Microdochium nivale]|nr:acetate kinase [Microdochium nivale]
MAASSSSASSYASTSITRPPSYGTYPPTFSSRESHFTAPESLAVSSDYDQLVDALRPLDLGPPGYQATILLFEGTAEEKTIYLGPWEVVGNEERRALWQCSYQMERLEHFLPSSPADTIPHTLHARHRQFSDPFALEQFVAFRNRQRVRYTNEDGQVLLDQLIEVKYEFTSVESSFRFQGDLRRKDLVDCFDVDVVWTDAQGRTDSFGNVKGIGTVQRLKLWADQYTSAHSLTVFANRMDRDRRYKEYFVEHFEGEVKSRDDRRRTLRLAVRGRRGSAPEGSSSRSLGGLIRTRQRSVGSAVSPTSGPDIRYLGIQFSRTEDFRRFLDAWVMAHSTDSEFRGAAFPHNRFELPSPEISSNTSYDLGSSEMYYTHMLPVPEVDDDEIPP